VEDQTALLTLRKVQAEARTAAINAEVADAKAQIGSVTGTSLTGTVTAQQGAGGVEASLLAASAIRDAVVKIKSELPKLGEGRRYILFAGIQRPDFADWRLFEVRRAGVLHAYERADDLQQPAARAAADAAAPLRDATPPAVESAAVVTAATGAALDIASKLGSYFQSDYTVGPTAIAGVDADLVAVTLAGLLPGAWYPARWPPPVPDHLAEVLLKDLINRRNVTRAERKGVEAAWKAAAEAAAREGDTARKAQFERVAARFAEVVEVYDAADKAFDALLDSLTTLDASGFPRIARVAEQKAISDRLAGGDVAVLVQLSGGAGTTFTKKNLWTFLWGMPFFVSGGAIVSFLAVDCSGDVKAGGQIPLHSGFLRVCDIPGVLAKQRLA
jgi:hypothetical protein